MVENHRLLTFIEYLQLDTDVSWCLSDLSVHQNPLLSKLKLLSLSPGIPGQWVWNGLRYCIFGKFPRDINTVGPSLATNIQGA